MERLVKAGREMSQGRGERINKMNRDTSIHPIIKILMRPNKTTCRNLSKIESFCSSLDESCQE